jgi:hypothetical protein
MLRIVVGFSQWLERKDVEVAQRVDQHVLDYLRFRKRSGYHLHPCDQPSLARMLKLLAEHGAIADRDPQPFLTPSEGLFQQYETYPSRSPRLAGHALLDADVLVIWESSARLETRAYAEQGGLALSRRLREAGPA